MSVLAVLARSLNRHGGRAGAVSLIGAGSCYSAALAVLVVPSDYDLVRRMAVFGILGWLAVGLFVVASLSRAWPCDALSPLGMSAFRGFCAASAIGLFLDLASWNRVVPAAFEQGRELAPVAQMLLISVVAACAARSTRQNRALVALVFAGTTGAIALAAIPPWVYPLEGALSPTTVRSATQAMVALVGVELSGGIRLRASQVVNAIRFVLDKR